MKAECIRELTVRGMCAYQWRRERVHSVFPSLMDSPLALGSRLSVILDYQQSGPHVAYVWLGNYRES